MNKEVYRHLNTNKIEATYYTRQLHKLRIEFLVKPGGKLAKDSGEIPTG